MFIETPGFKVNITRAIASGTAVRATGTVQYSGCFIGATTGGIRGTGGGLLDGTGSTTCVILKTALAPCGQPPGGLRRSGPPNGARQGR